MSPCSHCSRRKFLGTLLSAGGAVSGLVPLTGSAGGASLQNFTKAILLKIADFPALAGEGGSVMLTHDGGQTVMYLIRGQNDRIYVLDPTCPHEGCRVNPYDPKSFRTVCPCHGSAYEIDGTLLRGPATEGLRPFPSRTSGGFVEVELPELELGITRIEPVRSETAGPRLALTFSTVPLALYRLRRAPDPAADFMPTGFAVEKDSPADRTELTGDGDIRTVFVEAAGPRTFFKLELAIFEIG